MNKWLKVEQIENLYKNIITDLECEETDRIIKTLKHQIDNEIYNVETELFDCTKKLKIISLLISIEDIRIGIYGDMTEDTHKIWFSITSLSTYR